MDSFYTNVEKYYSGYEYFPARRKNFIFFVFFFDIYIYKTLSFYKIFGVRMSLIL